MSLARLGKWCQVYIDLYLSSGQRGDFILSQVSSTISGRDFFLESALHYMLSHLESAYISRALGLSFVDAIPRSL
jgi:hypothetical protein